MRSEGHRDLVRVPTGVAGLDRILRGGPMKGSSTLVLGGPGAGKTILGAQFAFHHARAGGRGVMVTVLTEPHALLLDHLRTLEFFDEAAIPDRLYVVSGYPVLLKDGLAGFSSMIQRLIRERNATVLVVDGLAVVETMAATPLEFQRFLHELNTFLSTTGCTAMFLTSVVAVPNAPELGVVDCIVELSQRLVKERATRELRVLKVRGTGFLEGTHVFKITSAGLTVFPRTELLAALELPPPGLVRGKQPVGIAQLDAMLDGGVPAASTTAVVGPAGSGKTLLGLSFLAVGEAPALYVGFYESPERLVSKAEGIGLRLGERLKAGTLEIMWYMPAEQILDQLGVDVLSAVDRLGAKRLFIDGISGIRHASAYPDRITAFFAALTNELRARGVTTVLSERMALFRMDVEIPIEGVSAIVENIILLRYVEWGARLRRLISILKVRESGYDSSLREFAISNEGIDIAPTFESAEQILTGIARALPLKRPSRRPAQRRGGRR